MRRHLLLVICVLSLVTGSTLLALGAAIRQPALRQPIGSSQDLIGLARAFYDAVNVTLATGDTGELDEIVAADIVEHPARFGASQGRVGLIASLQSRRLVFPGLQIVVDELTTTGPDRVTARVHTEGGTIGSFRGLSIPPSFGEWGPLDLFRIADGRIVERWGSLADPLVAETLGETAFIAEAPNEATSTSEPLEQTGTLVVSRMTLAPGAVMEVGEVLASELLLLTAGTVHVGTEGQSPRTLQPDDVLQVPPSTTIDVGNEGDMPAVVVTVTLWPIDVSPSSVITATGNVGHSHRAGCCSQWPIPIDVETLIAINAAADLQVRIGRVALAPGTTVSIPAEERSLLVMVEDGHLEIVKEREVIATSVRYSAGTSTIMETGSGGTLRASDGGSTSVLLFEISPPSKSE